MTLSRDSVLVSIPWSLGTHDMHPCWHHLSVRKLFLQTITLFLNRYPETTFSELFLCDQLLFVSLGPVLANMTELEKKVVDILTHSGRIKFYARYADDTLLLVKPEDVNGIFREFNSYHKNLEFTVDKFKDSVPHFLDLEIHPDELSIFRKETHTAQFVHHNSFTK